MADVWCEFLYACRHDPVVGVIAGIVLTLIHGWFFRRQDG